MSNPLVTVWLTSYNQGKYLRESIDSVLNQTFKDFELIICDDCSTDDSWEIIQSYDDPRIEKRRNEVNKGAHVTYEIIDACRGKYIAIHHSDDVWEHDKLEKQVAFMEGHPECACCFTKVKFIDENSEIWDLPDNHSYKDVFEVENKNRFEWLNYFFYKGNCLCHPSLLANKSIYRDYELLGGKGLYQLPDFRFWIKVCMHADIYIMPEYLIKFRIRKSFQTNTSSEREDTVIRSQYELRHVMMEYLKIVDKTEFLKIFPMASYYLKDGEINLKYAFARLLYSKNIPSLDLLASDLLYEILNSPYDAIEVDRLYNFNHKVFKEETGKRDIFFLNRHMKFLDTVLFLDTGNGYNSNEYIRQNVYIRNSGEFSVKYDLSNVDNVLNVRFDPDNNMIKIRIDKFTINGNDIELSKIRNNASKSENGVETFLHDDPQYWGEKQKYAIKEVCIQGLILDVKNDIYSIHKENVGLKDEINAIHKENVRLKDEINAIKSTKGYKLLEKIRKFVK